MYDVVGCECHNAKDGGWCEKVDVSSRKASFLWSEGGADMRAY